MTFSGTPNNRDIKAEIMEGARRNQRTVKLNMQQTTLSNRSEDEHRFRSHGLTLCVISSVYSS